MIYIAKQEGFYQNKVKSSLVSTCNYEWAIFCDQLNLTIFGRWEEYTNHS